jgi:hypothetical protein
MRALVCLLALMPALALAQPRAVPSERREEEIGSWRLSCFSDPMTDRGSCEMRHRLWVEVPKPNEPGIALEAINRFGQLIPVLTVRNLSLDAAARGIMALTATAQLRFDRHPLIELPCALEGYAVICAPKESDAAAVALQLLGARAVLVRVRGTGPLPTQGPTEPVALDLDRTAEALARFRSRAPDSPPPSTPLGQDWRELLERLMRLGGGAPDTPQRP